MTRRVSIIIPVIRPERAKRCVLSILKNHGIYRGDFEIVTAEDRERIGCPKMIKKLVKKARHSLICFLGDDCLPRKDFLKNALEEMDKFPDGWGMVGFNDNVRHHPRQAPAHWLAHRRLLEHLDGEFFNTAYWHCFCDNELTERCYALGRYRFCESAFVYHDHMIVNPSQVDADYRRVYSPKYWVHDMQLFRRRRDSGWTFNPGDEI